MSLNRSFTEQVAMKFRLYCGLFFDLPYEQVGLAGYTLPLFASFCREQLELSRAPDEIINDFFGRRMDVQNFTDLSNRIFALLRLVERQIVLFDAVEEATFHLTRDMNASGSLHDILGRIALADKQEDLAHLLHQFSIRIVLTAHPTQFYTEQVLGIIAKLRDAISRDDLAQVYRLLLQLGRTRFKKKERPSPFDEAKAVLWFMEHVLYQTLPESQQQLFNAAGYDMDHMSSFEPVLELGFWPGGDRDGNPNVKAVTTVKVGNLLNETLIKLYLNDLQELLGKLTFDDVYEKLQDIFETLAARINPIMRAEPSLRQGLYCVDPGDFSYATVDTFLDELLEVRKILIEKHDGLFSEDLDLFIHKVRCFGFYFASLDLRQDSRVLAKTLEEVLSLVIGEKVDFTALNQKKRLEFLSNLNEQELKGRGLEILSRIEDEVIRDGLEVFIAAREIQALNGKHGLHRFIVSNTQGPADLLTLRLLAILAGYSSDQIDFDLVPLFETIDDLTAAQQTMQTLFDHPVYRQHLSLRGNRQHVMLGFSDGTKDGGYVTANWSIYKAKQSLTSLARSNTIALVFFDGRGGPPARGGGNTHKFYRSLGRDIESLAIHLTIQGQTISSMYGNEQTARHNIEQLLSAGIDNNIFDQTEDWHLDDQESALIDELSAVSKQSYLALREDPDFLPYIQAHSPLSHYGQANISSRPTKRNGNSALRLEDLRAIPFVGAWSQLKQNIPGYFGLGTALAQLTQSGRLEDLRNLYRNSLFFRTLLENSMQSLSKVYLPLSQWHETKSPFGGLRHKIANEARLTIAMLLQVSGQESLLEFDPLVKSSIKMREELIHPLALIQQWALQELRRLDMAETSTQPLRAETEQRGLLEKMIIKSMAACVNASRNSV